MSFFLECVVYRFSLFRVGGFSLFRVGGVHFYALVKEPHSSSCDRRSAVYLFRLTTVRHTRIVCAEVKKLSAITRHTVLGRSKAKRFRKMSVGEKVQGLARCASKPTETIMQHSSTVYAQVPSMPCMSVARASQHKYCCCTMFRNGFERSMSPLLPFSKRTGYRPGTDSKNSLPVPKKVGVEETNSLVVETCFRKGAVRY